MSMPVHQPTGKAGEWAPCATQLQVVQQQLNALNTEAAAPAPAPGVSAAGTASSGELSPLSVLFVGATQQRVYPTWDILPPYTAMRVLVPLIEEQVHAKDYWLL